MSPVGLILLHLNFLRSQFATLNKGRSGRQYLPYAFTEQRTIAVVLRKCHRDSLHG